MYIRSSSSPSTILWAFHTIQPSSLTLFYVHDSLPDLRGQVHCIACASLCAQVSDVERDVRRILELRQLDSSFWTKRRHLVPLSVFYAVNLLWYRWHQKCRPIYNTWFWSSVMLHTIMDDAYLCQFLPLCTVAYVETLITCHFQEYSKNTADLRTC